MNESSRHPFENLPHTPSTAGVEDDVAGILRRFETIPHEEQNAMPHVALMVTQLRRLLASDDPELSTFQRHKLVLEYCKNIIQGMKDAQTMKMATRGQITFDLIQAHTERMFDIIMQEVSDPRSRKRLGEAMAQSLARLQMESVQDQSARRRA